MQHTKPQRLAVLSAAISLVLASPWACAQSQADTDVPASAAKPAGNKQLQTVVVTGTRTSNRTEAESLSPVDVLTPKDLNATGSTDLAGALNALLPSLDFPRPAINDGNDAIRPATLRGMSPDDVLVLVDGKRYHTTAMVNYNSSVGRGSSPVDLNSIPMSAIDHIEVLRDGAAAQYGSAAIAGVINVILKHGAARGNNSITASDGIMDAGDGAQNGVQGSMGIDLGGHGSQAKGWARVAWNYQSAMNTNRAENTDILTTHPGAANASGTPYQRYGDPASKTYQMLINFGYNITRNIELYGYINASRRNVVSNGYYRPWDDSARNVQSIYPNGFLPQIVNHTNDYEGVLGIRGHNNGWNWDFSGNYGENYVNYDIQNTINTSLYHSTGYSPTYFNAGAFRNRQGLLNLDMSHDYDWGLASPVTLAFGGEYRKEQYAINPGEADSYYFNADTINPATGTPYPGGSQVFPGLSPSVAGNWSRHSQAVYADLEADVTDKLSAGVAGRYEHYSDAGATRSGKVSARYQFTDSFALRGTVSNGFRAPSLAQQNYESVVTLIQNGQLAQIGTFRPSNPVAIALGAKPLKPEKSANYSFGGVWQPTNNFSASLDLYQIRVWDQILYSDQLTVTPTVDNPVSGAQFFVNGATTRTRGADLVANYRFDFSHWGTLNLTGSANYNQVHIIKISTPAFGRASQGLLTNATPHTKYVLTGDWQLSHFNLHANLTRYGTVTRMGDLPPVGTSYAELADQQFAARWLLDLSASYTVAAWTFTVGADNLTNQYPSKVSLQASGAGGYEDRADGLQYSSLSPFGFDGRYWYGKVTFRF